jgi:hypothetical protein
LWFGSGRCWMLASVSMNTATSLIANKICIQGYAYMDPSSSVSTELC